MLRINFRNESLKRQSLFSSSTIAGKLIGGFMVAIWDVSVYSHLISSINRLIVLCFPIASRNLLSQRNTIIMIAIVWFLGFLHFIPYFKVHDCYIVFSSYNYLWSFAPTTCGFLLGKVLDFGTGVTVFGLILLFDIFTIYRIRKLLKVAKRKIHPSEVKFFLQSCLQFGVFVVKLTCFYFISGFFTDIRADHWEIFFTTSFVWEFTHCIDGLILIPFHYKDYLNARRGNYMGKSIASSMAQRSRMELSKATISHSPIG
ncbi:unnamed protein product [Cylicocyclus nassatus]|uniref:G-protein coupled receptors family 1 profile domain-containing protein n=1 Tax=Cylicocyclus nassatus TaxID=53992 RepID=A0AA36DQE8_CYLNA|nr:unnamed protein product [Cylicocyclus nassatus]